MKTENKKTGKVENVKLPKAFKTKWLKALRSGKYPKGTGWLESDGKFCCLGVAVRMQHPKLSLHGGTIKEGCIGYGTRMRDINVPSCIKGEYNESHKYSEIVDSLIDLNDQNNSFEEVISFISRKL